MSNIQHEAWLEHQYEIQQGAFDEKKDHIDEVEIYAELEEMGLPLY